MMREQRLMRRAILLASVVAGLAGCGGGGGGGPSDAGVPLFVLGGTVTGLASGRDLLLLSGSGSQVTLKANGNFEFPDGLKSGTTYAVTVNRQPVGQTCTVQGDKGSIPSPGTNIRTLTVVCAANPYQLSGTVSGLKAGNSLTLADGGPDGGTLTLTGNGAFTFPSRFAQGNRFAVTVTAQPIGQDCKVVSPTSVFAASDINTVSVNCSVIAPTIGGSVSGLAQGQQVVLTNNGADRLTLSADGPFQFANGIGFGQTYSVAVATQPAGQVCSVSQASGVNTTANITSVVVSCASRTYAIGGSVVGLSSPSGTTGLTLLNNGTDLVRVAANGEFAFPTGLPSGATYAVTIASQPTGQTCQVGAGSGQVGSGDVRTVSVQCLAGGWRSRLLAGSGVGRTVDGIGSAAEFWAPAGSAFLPSGSILVAEISGSVLRRVNPQTGQVTTYSGANLPGYTDSAVTRSAAYRAPHAVAVDRSGNVFVADAGNHVIRRIDAFSGAVTTWAGTGQPGSNDGPGAIARFNSPQSLAVDAAGHVYVADTGNHVIRRIAPDQTVSTLAGEAGTAGFANGAATTAARFRGPAGIAVDPSGQIYIADSQNGAIRMLSLAGQVTTLAGNGSAGDADGAGALARLFNPTAIVVDAQYNLYVADSGNHKVRFIQVMQSGTVSVGVVQTIAGTGRAGDADGEALSIEWRQPYGLSLAGNGDLIVSEAGGHRLRMLFRSTAR